MNNSIIDTAIGKAVQEELREEQRKLATEIHKVIRDTLKLRSDTLYGEPCEDEIRRWVEEWKIERRWHTGPFWAQRHEYKSRELAEKIVAEAVQK